MKYNKFTFWYRWLLCVTVFSIFIGLLIAFLPNSFIFDLYNLKMTSVFFDGEIPNEAKEMKSFLFGAIGGTVSGYFIFQLFIVWNALYKKERWAWTAIVVALLLWFIVDSTVSLFHGAYFNI